jgi:hypothetical protein
MASNDFEWRKVFNISAFVAVICIALALILRKVGLSGSVINALELIANAIAYLITAISAFFYVRSRKAIWVWIVYFVAVILIFVFMFL